MTEKSWKIAVGDKADIAEVIELWQRVETGSSFFRDDERLADLLADNDHALFVARDGASVVGSLIAGWDGWSGHLYRLCVDSDCRRQGIAKALLFAAHNRLYELGATKVSATVYRPTTEFELFWEAMGYKSREFDRRYFRDFPSDPKSRQV